MLATLRAPLLGLAIAGLTVASFAVAGATPGFAQSKAKSKPAASCVLKAAQGTNSTRDGAMFQAWEAVLQATDWGSWASFMSSGAKVGTAPGYKVSNVKSKCKAGGLGFECVMQAKLCK